MDENARSVSIFQRLVDAKAEVRRQAIYDVGIIRGQIAEALIALLDDPDWRVRMDAARTIEHFPSPGAVKPLLRLLHDKHSEVRQAAAQYGIRGLGTPAIPLLEPLLAGGNPDTRTGAAIALGRLMSIESVPALVHALEDPTATVRAAAATSLGAIGGGTDDTDVALIAALSDENDDVRAVAAGAPGQLFAERAVEALISALSDESPAVRRSAVISLEQIASYHEDGKSEVLSALEAAKDSEQDEYVRDIAISSIRRMH